MNNITINKDNAIKYAHSVAHYLLLFKLLHVDVYDKTKETDLKELLSVLTSITKE